MKKINISLIGLLNLLTSLFLYSLIFYLVRYKNINVMVFPITIVVHMITLPICIYYICE